MNKALTILAAMTICAAIGCEKKRETSSEPPAYDADVDGPACIHAPTADARLLEDQTRIEAASPAPGERPAPGPGPAPVLSPVEQVKKQIGDVAAAVKAGQEDRFADLYGDQEAAMMKDFAVNMASAATKMVAFATAVKDQFGIDLSDKMKKDLAGGGDEEAPAAGELPKPSDMMGGILAVDELKLQQQGQDVVVTDGQGQKHKFVQTAQGWKIEMEPLGKALLGAFAEFAKGQVKLLDAAMAGIRDKSITKDNLDQQMEALSKQHLEPAAQKLGEAFGEMMKKALEGMGGEITPVPPTGVPGTMPAPPMPPPRREPGG